MSAWLNRLTRQTPPPSVEPVDTVMQWPPEAARVLVSAERHAHRSIAQALALEHPKGYLLAHVPLFKLVRVPGQHSYREWLGRAGLLTVDFVLCDEHGYGRAAVLLPLGDDQPRHIRKRDRLMRVLAATELTVTEWDRDCAHFTPEQLCARLMPKVENEAGSPQPAAAAKAPSKRRAEAASHRP
ncbi:hypothetical protein [Roseateles sp. BYS96W]|uniref:DUF2726 domain-containing protein n=1 Tax=Pelomonas nitida TaxID=3299027 RepID=A0ABW7G8U2_9BURK